jgi:hypothetical protein
MKNAILFLLSVSLSIPLFGQSNQAFENRAINRGRISTTDSAVIDAQHLVLSKDSVEYYVKESPDRYVMSLREVKLIEEYKGDRGTTGTWVGSLLGGGIGVAVALGTKDTKTTGFFQETRIQTWPIYVFTLAGGLIGYAVGSSAESWDPVYKSRSVAWHQKLELCMQPNIGGLCVTYRMNL